MWRVTRVYHVEVDYLYANTYIRDLSSRYFRDQSNYLCMVSLITVLQRKQAWLGRVLLCRLLKYSIVENGGTYIAVILYYVFCTSDNRHIWIWIQFVRSVNSIFPNFQHTWHPLNMTYIFYRYRRILTAIKHIKYGRDSKDLKGSFCEIENISNREIIERSFSSIRLY